jgi:hypothetical protein
VYDSGFRIFEYMDFEKTDYSISRDTIFYKNVPKCVIVNLDKSKSELTIKSLDDGKMGYYRDEREMLDRN